ncbi:hypothetical protein B0H17DRAFT_1133461 [Mycena rosella]|uniref:Uncharacterized protein n=1 Tax=Mycena rosella TaxID=1033263 RepID=A0AAD7DHK3_MYCRO|nr:hypothetical protein B0H17DRAFT_1133461 [Mycena rosella]
MFGYHTGTPYSGGEERGAQTPSVHKATDMRQSQRLARYSLMQREIAGYIASHPGTRGLAAVTCAAAKLLLPDVLDLGTGWCTHMVRGLIPSLSALNSPSFETQTDIQSVWEALYTTTSHAATLPFVPTFRRRMIGYNGIGIFSGMALWEFGVSFRCFFSLGENTGLFPKRINLPTWANKIYSRHFSARNILHATTSTAPPDPPPLFLGALLTVPIICSRYCISFPGRACMTNGCLALARRPFNLCINSTHPFLRFCESNTAIRNPGRFAGIIDTRVNSRAYSEISPGRKRFAAAQLRGGRWAAGRARLSWGAYPDGAAVGLLACSQGAPYALKLGGDGWPTPCLP